MNREQVKVVSTAIGVLIIIIALLIIGGWAQNESYKNATIENCKQYKAVPEKYIERVPDGCIPEYFKGK